MRRRQLRKKWLDYRSKKLKDKWYRKNKKHKVFYLLHSGEIVKRNEEYIVKVPSVFSFKKNTEETMEFFKKIIDLIEAKIIDTRVFIDSQDVAVVTTEALMYTIAIIYNMKACKVLRYIFRGNLPVHEEAQAVYKKSGFLKYFKTKHNIKVDASEYIQIASGTSLSTAIASEICDFINQKYNKDINFTKALYPTIIEMMTNTMKHAYSLPETKMENLWYLCAMHQGNETTITFLDTGDGIPNTVKKKWYEVLNPGMRDSELILASMTEKNRSETGLKHRGTGLPFIYNNAINGKLSDFFLLSGYGACFYDRNLNDIRTEEHKLRAIGTVFSFSIKGE